MARIRTIKPEFFTSEDIVSLTPLARLFYVSLWCESDREGRLSWRPKTLKMRYLPGDECSIDDLAKELSDSGLILIYEVDGKLYAEIPSFKNHQVINNRESDSNIPECRFDASPRVKAEGRKEGKGKEGKGREGNTVAKATAADGGESPPADLTKDELWRAGKSLLNEQGMPMAQCGAFVGKLTKDYGNEIVHEAVRVAVVERPADVASYLKAVCQRRAGERKPLNKQQALEDRNDAVLAEFLKEKGVINAE